MDYCWVFLYKFLVNQDAVLNYYFILYASYSNVIDGKNNTIINYSQWQKFLYIITHNLVHKALYYEEQYKNSISDSNI